MPSFHEIVGGVKATQAEVENKKLEARRELTEAQARIAAGDSVTGSDLHDGLILIYGDALIDYASIAQNFETVQADLVGSTGQPVLIIKRWLENAEHICFGGSGRLPRQAVYDRITVGVLDSDTFLFEKAEKRAYLPTARYITLSNRYHITPPDETAVVNGAIPVSRERGRFFQDDEIDIGYELGESLDLSRVELAPIYGTTELPALTVAAGNDAITRWAGERFQSMAHAGNIRRMKEMCHSLGVDTPSVSPYSTLGD